MNDKIANSHEGQLADQEGMLAGGVADGGHNQTQQPVALGWRQCIASKSDGVRCAAKAVAGSSYCFFHDPDSASARSAASRRGGEKTRLMVLPADTPDAPLSTAAELSALLGRTVNQLLRGQVDPKVASTVGYLLTVMMKATDLGKLEQRVVALETALKEKRSEPSLFEPEEFGGA